MRAVAYARYSSDLQRDASIEDQVRSCRELIQRQGWSYQHAYTDRALSGASSVRAGYQQLLEDARAGEFDIVVSEALDRLSRDQQDIAGLYKQLSFAGVKLVTVTEGDISELHVGLKGTMNALFLKDLVIKIRRGQRGRIEKGRSAGNFGYGYNVVREMDARGEPVRGGRAINNEQAAIVRRIFAEFATGRSPRGIAKQLNDGGVPGPSGKSWGPSTIYGNWRRGTGILNNECYQGRLVWNRQRFVRDPDTGKRLARYNPTDTWIGVDVPELRIVDDALWQEVKQRQSNLRRLAAPALSSRRPVDARRPRYLLSGLIKCGVCGSGYVVVSATHMACAGARDRGICHNHLRAHRMTVERSVLAGLQTHLMRPDLVKIFIREFNAELARVSAASDRGEALKRQELDQVVRGIYGIIEAIKAGLRSPTMTAELAALEARKQDLEASVIQPPAPKPRIHPNLANTYRDKITDLHAALSRDDARAEAADILRELIEEVRLVPEQERLQIELRGDLAAILSFAQKGHPGARGAGMKIKLVAEVCCHRELRNPGVAI